MRSVFATIQAYGCYWIGIVYHYWGNAYGTVRAYQKAVLWYQRALALDASLTQARLDRGILYWRELDDPRAAISDFNYLLAQDAENEAARFNRAVAYQQLGDHKDASADFQAYLSIGQHPHRQEYAETMLMELGDGKEGDDHQHQP